MKEELHLRRSDLILAVCLTALGILLLLLPFTGKSGEGQLCVRQNGKVIAVYPLSEDREAAVGEGNRFAIRNGQVSMTYADCPDGICMKSGPISREGETIVCLPHRLSLTIERKEDQPEADTVAR